MPSIIANVEVYRTVVREGHSYRALTFISGDWRIVSRRLHKSRIGRPREDLRANSLISWPHAHRITAS
jgi:hypothetical protein